MLIGISGKIGSGKDTVADIIKYLSDPMKGDLSFNKWYASNAYSGSEQVYGIWETKKFADTLKNWVCDLIGCTREQLEDHEFKNTPLGEEWTRYSYATGHTTDDQGNTTMLSTPCSKEKYEEERRINWQTAYKTVFTPRILLQLLGTEAGRKIIHPNIWVNSTFANYKKEFKYNPFYKDKDAFSVKEEDEMDNPPMYPNWLITDMRFPNEKDAVTNRGGVTIRVDRPTEFRFPELWKQFQEQDAHDEWDNYLKSVDQFDKIYHDSETGLDGVQNWDYYIYNNGSLEALIEQVEIILAHIKEKNNG